MPDISTRNTAIKFASSLRIGFRAIGSASGFTYITPYPTADQLPFIFTVPTAGTWEVEYTEICPNCSGGIYSDPVIVNVTVS